MRAAPAVAVQASGGRLWRLVNAVLPALAAASLTMWALQHAERSAWPAAMVVLLVVVLVFAAAWWRAQFAVVALNWDGQRWAADGTPGDLQVMVDLGFALLLRLLPEAGGAARWVPVTRVEAGAAWHGLRAAVYARPVKPAAPARKPQPVAD